MTNKGLLKWGLTDSGVKCELDGLILKLHEGTSSGSTYKYLTICDGEVIVYKVCENLHRGVSSLFYVASKQAEAHAIARIKALEAKLREEGPVIDSLEISREA